MTLEQLATLARWVPISVFLSGIVLYLCWEHYWGRRHRIVIEGKLISVKMHPQPIMAREVRKLVKESAPEFYPAGSRCVLQHCRQDSVYLLEMWPIEAVICPDPIHAPHVTMSLYFYACKEKHAVQFALSFWEPPQGVTA